MNFEKTFVPGVVPEDGDSERCYVPVCAGQLLCSADGMPWEPIAGSEWRFLNPQPEAQALFLGDYDGKHCYAVDIQQCRGDGLFLGGDAFIVGWYVSGALRSRSQSVADR